MFVEITTATVGWYAASTNFTGNCTYVYNIVCTVYGARRYYRDGNYRRKLKKEDEQKADLERENLPTP